MTMATGLTKSVGSALFLVVSAVLGVEAIKEEPVMTSGARLIRGLAIAVTTALAPTAGALASEGIAYRGTAHMGSERATVTFRIVGGHVVDFQLAALDVIDMKLSGTNRFSGCNTRAAAHPCVTGRVAAGHRSVRGTVRFGKKHHWTFSAHPTRTPSGR